MINSLFYGLPWYFLDIQFIFPISQLLSTLRVLGLKFPPLLLLISSISLIISFSSLLFNSEDYLNGLFDMVLSSVIIIFSLKNLPLCSLLSFPPINYGSSMTLISIKAFLSVSMIVGNLIDVYLFGLIAVLINYLLYFICLYPILPEWYFLLFHGCPRSIPPKTIGVIMILIVLCLLFIVYY